MNFQTKELLQKNSSFFFSKNIWLFIRKVLIVLFVSFVNPQHAQHISLDGLNSISLVSAVGDTLLRFDLRDFISVHAYHQKLRLHYGSIRGKRTGENIYKELSIDSVYQYHNSLFVTGNIGKFFPFEAGFFGEDDSEKKMWMSVKIYDSSQIATSIGLRCFSKAQHFWGGGVQFSYTDFAGKKFSGIVEENGIGRGDRPVSNLSRLLGIRGSSSSAYFPMPFFCTEKNYCFEFSPAECNIHFDTSGIIQIESFPYRKGEVLLMNLFLNEKMMQQSKPLPRLPHWAYGPIVAMQGGRIRVNELINKLRNYGAQINAIWIQDWVGRRKVRFGSRLWWTWQADTNSYPNLREWIGELNKKGIKVLGYINPFIVPQSPFFAEALQKNFLVKHKNDKPYKVKAGGFDAYLVNLLNPEAAEWYKTVIQKSLVENGFHGWMADFGEWFPFDAQTPPGFTSLSAHNFYPVVWARIQREVLKQSGMEDSFVVFLRSGNTGSLKHAYIFWAGDQTTDFGTHDGMPSAIRAMLSAAVSGIPYLHSDIGGYTNIKPLRLHRSRETLFRWIEWKAF
ncbi:MAG: hypothetical protein NZ522_06270, partial [Chitinophagales bacterium]|nr:hypothetical protein [Chitinophagales bacterium]